MRRLICHLIDANLDTSYFRSIARSHDRERFPVMIGSIAPAGPLQAAMRELGTPAFALGATARRQYPAVIWRLAQLLRQEGVAVLHAHCFDPTFIGLAAARLAGVPFVFTRHHSDHNLRLGKRWHVGIDAWCARHADHVIAVSEATRKVMCEAERVPETQITVVYNGMEPLREPAPQSVARVKEELGIAHEPVCLMPARLHEEKGHRFLFEALPEIVARAGSIIALLAGDGPHRAQLEAEARARGLEKFVRFLGRRNDMPELFSLASVVALPSLAESFGFVLVEAMSAGKPVVASTTGGIPEVVTDGETGLLVPQADAKRLAEAICEILQNPEQARTMGEAGRRRARHFTFDRMMRGYETVYEHTSLTRNSGRRPGREEERLPESHRLSAHRAA